ERPRPDGRRAALQAPRAGDLRPRHPEPAPGVQDERRRGDERVARRARARGGVLHADLRRRAALDARRRARRMDAPAAHHRARHLLPEGRVMTINRPIRLAFAAAGALALLGCRAADPDAPPSIAYGESPCAECGMIISDDRFGVATVVEGPRGPETLLFDDF